MRKKKPFPRKRSYSDNAARKPSLFSFLPSSRPFFSRLSSSTMDASTCSSPVLFAIYISLHAPRRTTNASRANSYFAISFASEVHYNIYLSFSVFFLPLDWSNYFQLINRTRDLITGILWIRVKLMETYLTSLDLRWSSENIYCFIWKTYFRLRSNSPTSIFFFYISQVDKFICELV